MITDTSLVDRNDWTQYLALVNLQTSWRVSRLLDVEFYYKSENLIILKQILDIHILYILLIKLISDAGFQSEITSISTAAQQIEVFSRVLKTSIVKFLTPTDDWPNTIQESAVSTKQIKYTIFSNS